MREPRRIHRTPAPLGDSSVQLQVTGETSVPRTRLLADRKKRAHAPHESSTSNSQRTPDELMTIQRNPDSTVRDRIPASNEKGLSGTEKLAALAAGAMARLVISLKNDMRYVKPEYH